MASSSQPENGFNKSKPLPVLELALLNKPNPGENGRGWWGEENGDSKLLGTSDEPNDDGLSCE